MPEWPDHFELVQGDLKYKIATKTAPAFNMWKIHKLPPKELGNPWPVDLLHQAIVGDELWWYCSPPITWENLCGREGWALVRDGKVIGDDVVLMN